MTFSKLSSDALFTGIALTLYRKRAYDSLCVTITNNL